MNYFIKSNNIIKLVCLLIVSNLLACDKILETDFPSNQVNSEVVFKEKGTILAVSTSLYSNLSGSSFFSKNSNGIDVSLSIYTDELTSFLENDELYLNSLTSTSTYASRWWNSTYTNVYAINAFIEGLSKSNSIQGKEKDVLLAEAYFLRALYFHYLTQLYGAIPYVKDTAFHKNKRVKKNSYQEVLALVEEDLKKALDLSQYEYRALNRLYPNKAVIELLLAKNYLLQGKYKESNEFAESVVENPMYEFESDINNVFKKTARSTMWQFSPSGYVEAFTHIFTLLPPPKIALNTALLEAFEDHDLRKKNWIKKVSNASSVFSHAYKYKNASNDASLNKDEYSIFFRLEEAYLVLAESLVYQDKLDDGLKVLNRIRSHRGLTELTVAFSKEELIGEVLEEQRREFFTEGGHRFFDLKRNNRLDMIRKTKLHWEDKHQLFPYPNQEILANPNILPQNIGY